LYITREISNGWETFHTSALYRALRRDEVTAALSQAGFRNVRWPLYRSFSAAIASAIAVNLWLVRPIRSTIGAAMMVLGLPFYDHWGQRPLASSQKSAFIASPRAGIDDSEMSDGLGS
jgi:hypothetical protein